MKTLNYRSDAIAFLGAIAAFWMLAPAESAAAAFTEPHTVFYGKVLGTGSARDFLITEGRLTWTIRRSDGKEVTLQTSLYAYHEDAFSYRLDVPHSAFALGLEAEPGDVPMPPSPQTHVHASVTLDGQPVTLLGPAGSAFTTEQLLRTATYRLDLGVGRQAVDTDGDGIPDWWEDRYGLDKQDPSDAALDLNGDGLTSLQSYLRGMDAAQDGRHPAVLTEDLVVYPSGTTGILLDTADLDSAPGQLVYTLTSLPAGGTLTRRNARPDPQNPDAVLAVGGQFTHAELMQGRVVYDHSNPEAAPGAFGVAVRDENPAHPASERLVRLLAFRPGPSVPGIMTAFEAQRLLNHSHASRGFVVLDATSLPPGAQLANPSAGLSGEALAQYQATYGDDRPTFFVGGDGVAWVLAGGHRSDVLTAGPGSGTLKGGGEADTFVFRSFDVGRVTIADFSVAGADVIDLSQLPAESGRYVHQYLMLAAVTNGYELRTDLRGGGVSYTNLVVELPGLAAEEADLYTLIESGRLRVGDLRLEPRVTVAATMPAAAENGPTSGRLTIRRQGSLGEVLSVNILLTGTAQNGVDYAYVPPVVELPAGVATVEIPITPYADGVTEPVEIIRCVVAVGTGYRIGTASQAEVTLEDLRMLVSIEALEPIAVKDPLTPGLLMVTRRDVIDRDVVIRFDIGGTAASGADYQSIANYLYMAANQSVAFIYVTPKATGTLIGGAETVQVSVRTNASYLIAGPPEARVAIIERMDSFAEWSEREFAVEPDGVPSFANEDSGNLGFTHFQRYAHGLDPHAPGTDGLPRPFLHQGRMGVTFRKPLGRDDVRFTVTGMTDLMNRSGSQVAVTPVPAPEGSTDPQRVYYQLSFPVSNAPSAFVEVKAEWIP